MRDRDARRGKEFAGGNNCCVFSHRERERTPQRECRATKQFGNGNSLDDSLRKFCERFADKAGTLHKAFTGGKNILCGKTLRRKEKKFPQAGYVHSTLTEKIHSLRIGASEGPIRSMVQGHDEATASPSQVVPSYGEIINQTWQRPGQNRFRA